MLQIKKGPANIWEYKVGNSQFCAFVKNPSGCSLTRERKYVKHIRLFSYYTKLTMLVVEAHMGKNKINSEKSYLQWGLMASE